MAGGDSENKEWYKMMGGTLVGYCMRDGTKGLSTAHKIDQVFRTISRDFSCQRRGELQGSNRDVPAVRHDLGFSTTSNTRLPRKIHLTVAESAAPYTSKVRRR